MPTQDPTPVESHKQCNRDRIVGEVAFAKRYGVTREELDAAIDEGWQKPPSEKTKHSPSLWSDTPDTRTDWQEAVADGKTELGLVEWLKEQAQSICDADRWILEHQGASMRATSNPFDADCQRRVP